MRTANPTETVPRTIPATWRACSSSPPTSFEDKKLNIIGWNGPKAGLQAVKDAAKSFAKRRKRKAQRELLPVASVHSLNGRMPRFSAGLEMIWRRPIEQHHCSFLRWTFAAKRARVGGS